MKQRLQVIKKRKLTGDCSGLYATHDNISGDCSGVFGNCSCIIGDITSITGCVDNLYGDVGNLLGDVTGLRGYCTGVFGNCTGLQGDFDNCELTYAQRKEGVPIAVLIENNQKSIDNQRLVEKWVS